MQAHIQACTCAHSHLHMCTLTPTAAHACAHLCLFVCTPKPAHVHTHAHACTCTRRFTLYRRCFSGGSRVDHLIGWIGTTLYCTCQRGVGNFPPRKGQEISTTEVSGSIHHGLSRGCYLTTIHRTLHMPVLGILCSEETG